MCEPPADEPAGIICWPGATTGEYVFVWKTPGLMGGNIAGLDAQSKLLPYCGTYCGCCVAAAAEGLANPIGTLVLCLYGSTDGG